jgi:hypothetical protein
VAGVLFPFSEAEAMQSRMGARRKIRVIGERQASSSICYATLKLSQHIIYFLTALNTTKW